MVPLVNSNAEPVIEASGELDDDEELVELTELLLLDVVLELDD